METYGRCLTKICHDFFRHSPLFVTRDTSSWQQRNPDSVPRMPSQTGVVTEVRAHQDESIDHGVRYWVSHGWFISTAYSVYSGTINGKFRGILEGLDSRPTVNKCRTQHSVRIPHLGIELALTPSGEFALYKRNESIFLSHLLIPFSWDETIIPPVIFG